MELHATSRNETSPTGNASPTTGAAAPAPEMVTPVEISPSQMVVVRRRRGKRRSRADKAQTPQRRAYIVLLCVVFVLMAVAAVKPMRRTVYNTVHSLWPGMAHSGISIEVVALVLAGLVLLYLMPGMEERILGLLNGGGNTKRNNKRR